MPNLAQKLPTLVVLCAPQMEKRFPTSVLSRRVTLLTWQLADAIRLQLRDESLVGPEAKSDHVYGHVAPVLHPRYHISAQKPYRASSWEHERANHVFAAFAIWDGRVLRQGPFEPCKKCAEHRRCSNAGRTTRKRVDLASKKKNRQGQHILNAGEMYFTTGSVCQSVVQQRGLPRTKKT